MNQNFSSTAIVGEVTHETECLLTEDSRKFLLFFDLLFVKDSAELIQFHLTCCCLAERI